MKKILSTLGIFFTGGLVSISTVLAVGNGIFPDVDPNAYYADGVTSVNMKGFMTGYSNGNFGPNDPVTRGQLATILKRYDDRLFEGGAGLYTGMNDIKTILCNGIGEKDFNSNATEALKTYKKVCALEVE